MTTRLHRSRLTKRIGSPHENRRLPNFLTTSNLIKFTLASAFLILVTFQTNIFGDVVSYENYYLSSSTLEVLLQTSNSSEVTSSRNPISLNDDDSDEDCPYRNSPLYRSVYVYPSPGDDEWKGDILSDYGKQHPIVFPWIDNDRRAKNGTYGPYDIDSQMVQFNTELIVKQLMTHPKSCLRTYDPEQASLFYVPYLMSTEFHDGSVHGGNYTTSPYANAITDILDNHQYQKWEETFGLTSNYWKRRSGSDHMLVYGEPFQGLFHLRSRAGSTHYIQSQKQLKPPIAISIELSKTFVEMYPSCARKNILMPYPNTNGRWFNGGLDKYYEDKKKLYTAETSPASLEAEKQLQNSNGDLSIPRMQPRPLAQYYQAGAHGACKGLRMAMTKDYRCRESGKYKTKTSLRDYSLGYRQATFCPAPGGDSPSAKRMFDALHAGCIPIILSEDCVWPFSNEVDAVEDDNNKQFWLNPSDFSIRVNAADYSENKHDDTTCQWKDDITNKPRHDLQTYIDSIPANEIQRLRQGAMHASDIYSYYQRRDDLPDNPLLEDILPDGKAAHALVAALAKRAGGVLWPACEEELKKPRKQDPKRFKC